MRYVSQDKLEVHEELHRSLKSKDNLMAPSVLSGVTTHGAFAVPNSWRAQRCGWSGCGCLDDPVKVVK